MNCGAALHKRTGHGYTQTQNTALVLASCKALQIAHCVGTAMRTPANLRIQLAHATGKHMYSTISPSNCAPRPQMQ